MALEPRIVAGIPAYNEEKMIARVILRTAKHVDKIIVVDDGSDDDTAIIAEKLGAVVVKHEKNLGKGAAMRSCLEVAMKVRPDVFVTIDADGQHDPDEIPALIEPILKGEADVVIGSRMGREIPRFRRVGARLLDYVTDVKAGGIIVDAQSGFRAYSLTALSELSVTEYGMGVDTELIMRAKEASLRIMEVPISVKYEDLETSTHNPFYHWFDVFFTALKFISIRHALLFYGGFAVIMFSVAVSFGIQTIDYYRQYHEVVTNLALVSISAGLLAFLSLFTALILFTLITVLREKR